MDINEYSKKGLVVFTVLIISIITMFVKKEIAYYFSDYFRSTHKLKFMVKRNRGDYGEYKAFKKLQSFKGEKRFLANVYLPSGRSTTEVDLIMIHESGIYVIESKNYSGTVYGSENRHTWCHLYSKNKKYNFYNPIWQNNTHVNALKRVIDEDINCYNVVVFGEDSTLKAKISGKNYAVTHFDDLLKTCNRLKKNKKAIDVNGIYNQLLPYARASRKTKRSHVEFLCAKACF